MKHNMNLNRKQRLTKDRLRTPALIAAFVCAALVLGMLFAIAAPLSVKAEGSYHYTSEESGYQAVLEDNADLLTEEQEAKLFEKIKGLLSYGNMAFVTNVESNSDAHRLAERWFLENFGQVNGTVLMIDMYNRRIEFFSGQEMYRLLNTARTNEISDNIYTYATQGDYYSCADKAFDQMRTILEGGAIYTPMKYATNAAFAIGIAFLINFIIIYRQRKKSRDTLALRSATDTTKPKGAVVAATAVMTSQSKTRHVQSSGGGGGGFSGGGGGGFSGGGGGGGFSGGGGGHSF